MKFGAKVRDLRKKNNLTQDELAKCLGVSKRTIIGWERNERYPRNVEVLEKMSDIFHVPLTYLQPDQALFIERAAAIYGKNGKKEAQYLAFELTEPVESYLRRIWTASCMRCTKPILSTENKNEKRNE